MKEPFLPLREHKFFERTLAAGVLISLIVDTKICLSAIKRAQAFRGNFFCPCANIIYRGYRNIPFCHRENTDVSREPERLVR
jgi:hypothetical protein